jgi:hypothetical protein
MKTLKTLALIGASALAVSAVSTAAAQAQPWHGYGYGYGYGYGSARYADSAYDSRRLTTGYVDRLDARVVDAARERLISWPEARDLRGALSDARTLAWRVQTGRADRWEVRRLDSALDRVEAAVSRYADNDRDRYRGYGRDNYWRR